MKGFGFSFFSNLFYSLYSPFSLFLFVLVSAGPGFPQALAGEEEELDLQLQTMIRRFNFLPMKKMPESRKDLVHLGKTLFFEKKLSGNKNISCSTCHHPNAYSGDSFPLSIGQGGSGEGRHRRQSAGEIIPRHSPALFNLGAPEITEMFWDGRVSYNPSEKTFQTPEAVLNGRHPLRQDIVKQLTGALSAQTIFPLLSHEEMRGKKGENELADASTSGEVWDLLMERILPTYLPLFLKAFPEERARSFNIGHVGQSLAAFIKDFFASRQTPYDKYVAGDTQAMTLPQKRGFQVFLSSGQCFRCHSGPHLSNFQFMNVGVPHITTEDHPTDNDAGRFLVTKNPRDTYKFKTPPLRNVHLTAPYMHNGAFSTLREVIDHYNDVQQNLFQFQFQFPFERDGGNSHSYSENLLVDKDPRRNHERFESMDFPFLRRGLGLTEREKKDLLIFLEEALTDQSMKEKLDQFPSSPLI